MWGYRSIGGRGRRFPRRGAVAALAVLAGLLAQAGPASATHEDRALEVTPEVDRTPTGKTTTLRAEIDPGADGGAVAIDFEIVAGPNARLDGNGPNTPTSPDLSCTIPDGDSACIVAYKGKKRAGVDSILAWIDHDADNGTVEADTDEEPDAGGEPDEPGCPESECGPPDTSGAGSVDEPDSTDHVLAQWGQLKANHEAVEDGPAAFQTKGCDSAKDRNKKGRVVATAKACTFVYTVPPADDLSDNRNFGAVFIQSQVDAKRNWCVEKVKTEIRVPGGARLEGTAPTKKISPNNRKLTEVTLRVGDTTQVESVSRLRQSFYTYPGELRTLSRDGGDRKILVWKGSTRKSQAFALAIAISWNEDDGFPDFSSAGGALKRFIVKKGKCIPGEVG